MKIVDEIVKGIIREEIEHLEVDDFGQVLIDREKIDAPPLDHFLAPEPDFSSDDQPWTCRPTDPPDTVLVLGRYYPMSSPGQVVLYRKNLQIFYRSLIREVLRRVPSIDKADLERIARLVVLKTYYHELFHFDCNLLRRLFCGAPNLLVEEALAVAWSRHRIALDRKVWQCPTGRMNGVVYGWVMKLAFAYRSAGYCDWPLYADESRFKVGLCDYIHPEQTRFLEQSGVPVGDLLFDMLDRRQAGEGFREWAN
jgi:hypothetical protein